MKRLSLIVGFAVTVVIWPREVVSCRDFIFRAVATFWAMSLVGIYPGRASQYHIQLPSRLKEISKVISVGVEGKKFSKRRRHDVLLVLFWLGALEFKILKSLFFVFLIFSSAISPDFQYINL